MKPIPESCKKIIQRCKKRLTPLFYTCAPKIYSAIQRLQNKVAIAAFTQAVTYTGSKYNVSHPFYLKNPQYVSIGDNFLAGPGLRIEAWDIYAENKYQPEIVIGDGVIVNFNVHIGAIRRIEIGNNVLIGSNVLITDHSHGTTSGPDLRLPPLLRPLVDKGPVVIEDNVWIGENACILSGVRVGKNAIVGANAVVTRDVAAGEIVGGIPAKTIKRP